MCTRDFRRRLGQPTLKFREFPHQAAPDAKKNHWRARPFCQLYASYNKERDLPSRSFCNLANFLYWPRVNPVGSSRLPYKFMQALPLAESGPSANDVHPIASSVLGRVICAILGWLGNEVHRAYFLSDSDARWNRRSG